MRVQTGKPIAYDRLALEGIALTTSMASGGPLQSTTRKDCSPVMMADSHADSPQNQIRPDQE